jgi:hypothetical protein
VLSEWEAGGAIGPAKDLIKMKQSKNNQWNITKQSQFLRSGSERIALKIQKFASKLYEEPGFST